MRSLWLTISFAVSAFFLAAGATAQDGLQRFEKEIKPQIELKSFTYGSASAIGSSGYGYDSENRLVSAPGGTTLTYDPLGRLYQVSDGTTTRLFLYDGDNLFGEYATNGAPLMFYEHGPGVDEPVMSFNYTTFEFGTFHGDERGSVARHGKQPWRVSGRRVPADRSIVCGDAAGFKREFGLWRDSRSRVPAKPLT